MNPSTFVLLGCVLPMLGVPFPTAWNLGYGPIGSGTERQFEWIGAAMSLPKLGPAVVVLHFASTRPPPRNVYEAELGEGGEDPLQTRLDKIAIATTLSPESLKALLDQEPLCSKAIPGGKQCTIPHRGSVSVQVCGSGLVIRQEPSTKLECDTSAWSLRLEWCRVSKLCPKQTEAESIRPDAGSLRQ